MTNSATVAHRPSNVITLLCGPGLDSIDPLAPRHGVYSGESRLLTAGHDQVDVSVSGDYTGLLLHVVRCRPDGTDDVLRTLTPADGETTTYRVTGFRGTASDIKVRAVHLASGSVSVSLASYRDGQRPA